ncbi:hypothetical protein LJC05_03960, partial [Bacteroides sp. OttesenSCG-928-J23]|nr:hypothetical protein [Bacteroides sp. OttesenSCG-928-J23]
RNTQATRADITEDFTLTGDIDLTGVEWVPIGAPGNPYYGTFDGGGHTIKGLKVNVSGNDDAGLFGNFSGVVKNLTVEGANVKGTWDAGAIVGYNAGACIIACRAINCTVEGGSAAGGIVGLNLGVVVACHTKGGSIQGYYSGGIAGVNNYNKIIACVAEPETVTGSGSTGVLVGENSAEGLLTTCYWRAGTGATGAIGKDYTNNPHTTTELEAGGITPDECDAMNDAIENYNNNLKGHEAHKLCTFRWSSTSIPGSGGGITIGGFDDEGEIPVGAIDN